MSIQRIKNIPFIFAFLGGYLWGQPKILVSKNSYDFGKISINQLAHGTIKVSNIGDDILLFSTSTSCGCTTAVLGRNRLLPGESSDIDVTFDSKGQQGRFFKPLVVSSNDPTNRVCMINLVGEVMVDLYPEPNPLYLTDCIPGTTRTGTIHLNSASGKPIKIIKLAGKDLAFIHAQQALHPEGPVLDVQFSTKNAPGGQRQGTSLIQIVTDSELQPVVFAPIVWSIESSILVNPDPVAMTGFAGKELRIPIELSHRRCRSFKIIRGEYIGDGLRLEYSSHQSSPHHSCTLVAKQTLAPGRYTGNIDLFFDDPDQTEIKIRVAIVIQ